MAMHATTRTRPIIDLNGPEGNAFVLLGMVRTFGRQLSWSQEKIDTVRQEMQAGDYASLVRVFDREFGQFVDLLIPEALEAELLH